MKLFNVSSCVIVAFSTFMAMCWAAPTAEPVWLSDKSLSEQLASAVSIAKYQIRPPKGYIALHTLSGPSGSSADSWAGITRPDGTRPYIMFVHLTIPPKQANQYTLKQISDKMLAAIERRRKAWKQSPTEQGIINGLTFMRSYWQGTDVANGQPMHGFSYVAKDGNTILQLSSQDFDPYQKVALPLAEASALTIKKQ